jgi:hypothetical protein
MVPEGPTREELVATSVIAQLGTIERVDKMLYAAQRRRSELDKDYDRYQIAVRRSGAKHSADITDLDPEEVIS